MEINYREIPETLPRTCEFFPYFFGYVILYQTPIHRRAGRAGGWMWLSNGKGEVRGMGVKMSNDDEFGMGRGVIWWVVLRQGWRGGGGRAFRAINT